MSIEKKVSGTIRTTEEHLKHAGLSLEDVVREVRFLAKCFGKKYPRMFPLDVNSNDIDQIIHTVSILKKIESCDGFKRHLIQYDKNNIEDHLFTAKVAGWLLDKNYKVTLEPELESPEGGKPDLFVEIDENEQFVVECKNIDISNFYKIDKKQEIANIVYEKVQTCDQIDLYLSQDITHSEVRVIFSNTDLVTEIHKLGCTNIEAHLVVSEKLEIGIIRKPPIIGKEEGFLTAALGMILEDNVSKQRLPGFAFMRGGRSVGVWGPLPDYGRRWDDKRSKSKKQVISGYPMVVMVNGDNVLGDPQLHQEYFDNVWLTERNTKCSGVGLVRFVTENGNPDIEYFKNPKAEHLFEF